MRHGKKFNHLSRKSAHRKAMLSNMASSLILHKRINTTVAKAKALRKFVEPLITRGKTNTTHSRRVAFRYLQSKEAVKELFDNVSQKIASRPGGYTRILKTGFRYGDNADMCFIELVDYNETMTKAGAKSTTTTKKRRTRRSKGGNKAAAETTTVDNVVDSVDATTADIVTDATDVVEDTASDVVADATDAVEDAANDVVADATDAVEDAADEITPDKKEDA